MPSGTAIEQPLRYFLPRDAEEGTRPSNDGIVVRRPLSVLRYGHLTNQQLANLGASTTTLGGKNIWIEEGSSDMRSIASRCRILKNKGLELVIIDYLQLIAPLTTKRDVSREREVAEISRSLKLLAMELKVAVIALSQLNDGGRLRESRAIGQDPDLCYAQIHRRALFASKNSVTGRVIRQWSNLMDHGCAFRKLTSNQRRRHE